jgi:hypothetical protein
MRARDYDPTVGAFTTTDPLDRAVGDPWVDAYAYTDGNPVQYWDPSGLRSWNPLSAMTNWFHRHVGVDVTVCFGRCTGLAYNHGHLYHVWSQGEDDVMLGLSGSAFYASRPWDENPTVACSTPEGTWSPTHAAGLGPVDIAAQGREDWAAGTGIGALAGYATLCSEGVL